MFTKQNLLATLAGFGTMFLLGWGIWGFATVDFFEGHTLNNFAKNPPDALFIALANIIAAFALSSIYGKWARGVHSAKEGLQFGALIGIFTGLGMGLLTYATMAWMDLTAHIAEAVIEVIYYGIVGAVIAIAYKASATKNS